MNPRLLVIAGPLRGAVYPVADDSFTIGRDPQNHFSLPDTSVSRRHCLIVRQTAGFFIRDLESNNGTLVNDVRIQDQLLAHRDYITVGRAVLQFLIEDEIIFADPAGTTTMSLPADQNTLLAANFAPADMHALLRVSTMLHSFHAMYRGRRSSSRDLLERHLLSTIFEVIPARRGAILLYQESLDEPSSLAVKDQQPQLHRPVAISRKMVQRALSQSCGLLVEDASQSAGVVAEAPQALLLAPLLIRGRPCGVIYLEGVSFGEMHLQLLITIAHMASMAVENAFQLEWFEIENERLEAELHPDHHMLGDSPLLGALLRNIARAARTNSTVLILGETGTGKELAARAIHQGSSRASKPFVAVNCAALSENLLESELFGHEKGAFTGAFARKKGRLEAAEGGSLFLDEIGELPVSLQVKLLRVLQEHEIERVGSTQSIKLDIRVIAATNRNLKDEVGAGRFRQDLYYRLNVVTLKTPPLRDWPSDILPLAMHFAAKFGRQCGRRISGISPEAQAYLTHYQWPGNIRELENALERAVVLCAGDRIEVEDLPESIREITRPAGVTRNMPLQDAVDGAKRKAVTAAFEQAGGEHAEAARLLGVHPNYLYRLMRNLALR